MSLYTVRELVKLLPDPDPESTSVGTISPGERIISQKPLNGWVRVEASQADGSIQVGWILASSIEEIVGKTVKLYPEPFSEKFEVVTGSIEVNITRANWQKIQVSAGAKHYTGWIDSTEKILELSEDDGLNIIEDLSLGVNEVYRRYLIKAQEITGIDASSLAALVDAEATKITKGSNIGQWNRNAFNPRSNAAGLTQFLSSTWIEHARKEGTLLNKVGKDKGYITTLNAVASGKRNPLLKLRFDPELSIVSAAEYGLSNLKALDRKGLTPQTLSDDEKARLMYLAHHEGPTGALKFLMQDNSSSIRKFNAQVGRRRAADLVRKARGNVALAYRNWLNDYMDKKIQPEKFRASTGTGGPFIASASNRRLEKFRGSAVPMYSLGGDRGLAQEIQEALSDLGYLDPPADGLWGSVSGWALDEFCQDNLLSLHEGFTPEIAKMLVNPKNPLPDIKPTNGWFDNVISYMNDKGYWICRHPDCTNIVYLEGVNPDGSLNDDRPNEFNDLRIVFTVNGDGEPKVTSWEGTTEPGVHWTIKKLMDPRGAARIAFGQYKSWMIGKHPRKYRPSQHEALVQERPVPVYRDLNKDFKRTNDRIYTGNFGINQHWGYDLPKHDLGTSSAGCLVGRTRDGHKEFMSLIKEDARYLSRNSYKFMTAILPGDKVFHQSYS
ncbi:hypothetical protein [Microbulbifer variabilis]|uniref:hypothetical protein n=1 Tax=Microbulbifer variabilis TaxID=266805 RepID=UPI0003736ED2|nr:hypothetical protein [Microbulbifer variabilis]